MASDEIKLMLFAGELSTQDNLKHLHPELVAQIVKQVWPVAYAQGRSDAWRWIPVSERVPEIDQDNSGNHPHLHEYMQSKRVLACFKDKDMDGEQVFTGRFVSVLREKHASSHEQWFESDSEGSVELEDVTHWLPITLPTEAK